MLSWESTADDSRFPAELNGGGGWEKRLWDWWGLSDCVLCQNQSIAQSLPSHLEKIENPAIVTAD